MRRIAFIGTISKQHRSTQLITLYNESRIYNTEHDIKGVFLVCKDVILQILEGDATELGKAVYRARREEHLEDFGIIINAEIEKGIFNSWPIRFIKQNDRAQNSFISKLKKALSSQLVFNNGREKELFDSVFTLRDSVVPFPSSDNSISEAGVEDIKDFSSHSFSISAWPKPTQLRLTPQVISACSALIQGSIKYDDLVVKNIWHSEEELQGFLTRLNGLGLLHIQDARSANTQGAQVTNDKFSQLLKKFIHAPRRQVT